MGSRYLARREVMTQTSGFFFAVSQPSVSDGRWRKGRWREGRREKKGRKYEASSQKSDQTRSDTEYSSP